MYMENRDLGVLVEEDEAHWPDCLHSYRAYMEVILTFFSQKRQNFKAALCASFSMAVSPGSHLFPSISLAWGRTAPQHWEAHGADAMVEEGSQTSSHSLRAQSPVKDNWRQEGEGALSLHVMTRLFLLFNHRVCWGKEWYFSLGL